MLRARDNPFAIEHVLKLRYRFGNDDWTSLLNRLQSLSYRAAIVGPHGSGKTTLLEDLGERLSARGFQIHRLFLNEQSREYPAEFLRRGRKNFTSNDIILFDGCEQLGSLAWLRFRSESRRAGGLVITTHAGGRLPTLRTCETNRGLLGDLVCQLMQSEKTIAPEILDRLFDKHRGNLRDVLRELYDRAATEHTFRLFIEADHRI
jgi:adenylate kinase family enzyme